MLRASQLCRLFHMIRAFVGWQQDVKCDQQGRTARKVGLSELGRTLGEPMHHYLSYTHFSANFPQGCHQCGSSLEMHTVSVHRCVLYSAIHRGDCRSLGRYDLSISVCILGQRLSCCAKARATIFPVMNTRSIAVSVDNVVGYSRMKLALH